MLYLSSALALVAIMIAFYLTYKRADNQKQLLKNFGLLLLLIVLTYSTKLLFIYKPLLLLHLGLLIMAWANYYRAIFSLTFNKYKILSPLISLTLFIAISLFFRENG